MDRFTHNDFLSLAYFSEATLDITSSEWKFSYIPYDLNYNIMHMMTSFENTPIF
jgi:hypothetical protein